MHRFTENSRHSRKYKSRRENEFDERLGATRAKPNGIDRKSPSEAGALERGTPALRDVPKPTNHAPSRTRAEELCARIALLVLAVGVTVIVIIAAAAAALLPLLRGWMTTGLENM